MSAVATHVEQLEAAAKAAGLVLTASEPGTDFTGAATTRTVAALASDPSKIFVLELGNGFDIGHAKFAAEVNQYFADAAQRLKNPDPNFYFTLLGLPLTFSKFAWPVHGSTSGADSFLVHGEIQLATGDDTPLHAKVSAAMTQTFKEVLPAMEQPFAESFIYNAVRKTLDQGQLELVKSGNRQPVPVSTRYYSSKQQRFIFNDTDEQQRKDFLKGKVFWLSGVLGAGAPVWVVDPRDAQYLNTTTDDLLRNAFALVQEGYLEFASESGWATITDKLRAEQSHFEQQVEDALTFIKPSFNEDMRGGHTNM